MIKRVIQPLRKAEVAPFYSGVSAKLSLAVAAATLTSFSGELSRYTCSHYTWADITPIHWVTIVIGATVQGVIAWRAFIDGSAQKQREHLQEDAQITPNKIL